MSSRASGAPHVRSRSLLGVFASLASIGLVAALLVEPTGLSTAATFEDEAEASAHFEGEAQTVEVLETDDAGHARDAFDVVKARPAAAVAPAAGNPDPGTAQAIAYEMVSARGWGQSEYDCLVALWNKESHWNVYAHNASSGAYGIPQALPGSKMASAGSDWATNPSTQITWGLGYVAGRYGTPCAAWGHSQVKGWY